MSSQKTNPIPWLVWSDSNNEVIASGELSDQSELSNLTRYAQGRAVTVIANSADVRLMKHDLAMKPTRQVLKALPYMLEEELAEDIEKLHFAIESSGYDKTRETHFVQFAVVNKLVLQSWLETLETFGFTVKHLVPEVLCMPHITGDSQDNDENGGSLSIIKFTNGYLIREGAWQGSFIEADWMPLFFQQLSHKKIHHYSELPADFQATSDDVELIAEDPELPMLLFAQQAAKLKWNLLQGEFAPKKPVSKAWQTWRSVAALGGTLLVIQLFMTIAETQQNKAKLEAARTELTEMYKQAFPNERLRVNLVRQQLTRKVAELGSNPTASNFEFMQVLERCTPVFNQFDNVKIENLRFDGKRNEMRLTASASSFQEFEQFRIALAGLGLTVQTGAVNNEGSTVTGSISLQEAS